MYLKFKCFSLIKNVVCVLNFLISSWISLIGDCLVDLALHVELIRWCHARLNKFLFMIAVGEKKHARVFLKVGESVWVYDMFTKIKVILIPHMQCIILHSN